MYRHGTTDEREVNFKASCSFLGTVLTYCNIYIQEHAWLKFYMHTMELSKFFIP